jgi:hypothetical protein
MRKPSHLPAYGPGKHRKQSPPRRTGANTLQARLSVKTLRADRSAVPRAPHEQSRLDPSKPYAIMNVADHEVIFASTDYARSSSQPSSSAGRMRPMDQYVCASRRQIPF